VDSEQVLDFNGVFRVAPDERILYVSDTTGGLTMAFDVDPEGQPWGTIEVPDGRVPANCAFGGDDSRTLYITAREALYTVPLVHPVLY
jgi:sugar lactone lactonase YvrE